MARKSNNQRLTEIHTDAKERFNRVWSSQKETREQCQEDRRFATVTGAQWEGRLGDLYENRPRLEINKTQIALQRITSEYRNNRISADFIPKDGTQDDELADACDGLYRADEQDSQAEESYDNAFDEGINGGIGAWRLCAEYENEDDEEDERQRIRFEPIFDADTSVFFDIDAKRQDKSDAEHCWVIYSQDTEAFKEKWGEDPNSWPKDTETGYFDWCGPDVTYLAEYYRVQKTSETLHVFADPKGDEVRYTEDEILEEAGVEDFESALEVLNLKGIVKLRERKVKRREVRKYIMSGGKILEDCGRIAGKNIPIVMFFAKRWFVDSIERAQGHVRLAKDPQRVKNTQYSKLAELAAKSSDRKPIFLPEQVQRHQVMWQEDNIKNYPYLLVDPIVDTSGQKLPSGQVGEVSPPDIPPALAALLQISETDMMDILGRPQDGQEILSNVSGKAYEAVQQRLDMQAFLYMSNFAKAMRRSAEIWLSMAKELYVEEGRRMKSIGEQGNVESVELMTPMLNDETGAMMYRNDLSKADFDVAVDVGPSFISRREATVRALTGVMQTTTDPQDLKILSALILMNTEGEGLTDVRDYYRQQLVGMGVIPPSDQEREAMEAAAQNAEPDPQAAFLESEAQKNMADAQYKQAQTAHELAETEKTVAETEKINMETGAPPAP